eukprot:gene50274-5623_t
MCQQPPWVVRLNDHTHHGCGVAVDPFGKELVTCADDQKAVFYTRPNPLKPEKWDRVHVQTSAVIARGTHKEVNGMRGLLVQDKLRSVVRRPVWSPDGVWLLMPGCYHKIE